MDLIKVVKACCDVLASVKSKMGSDQEKAFREAAWNLITQLAYETVERLEGTVPTEAARRSRAGGVVEVVPVETAAFVQILLARRRGVGNIRSLFSRNKDRAAVTVRGDLDSGSPDGQGDFSKWESGSDEGDVLREFEGLLWAVLFRDFAEGRRQYKPKCSDKKCKRDCDIPDCDKKLLYGEIDQDKVVRFKRTPPGESTKYAGLAAALPQISFVETRGSTAHSKGIREYEFAKLIREFADNPEQAKESP